MFTGEILFHEWTMSCLNYEREYFSVHSLTWNMLSENEQKKWNEFATRLNALLQNKTT